jgi:glycosyltransferase involved in cell wall biosynthesis
MAKVSVVINTLNEQENIKGCLESVKWADELVVVDMESEDQTAEIAKRLGAKVYNHPKLGFVEPARNYAISKASNEWILILDADEEIPASLAQRLHEMVKKEIVSEYVEIPRKNIIFGKWMQASMWWPDYNIRFFKKGSVKWSNKIHSKPQTSGQGLKLDDKDDEFAIIHHHYSSLSQYLERLIRYTRIQAEELEKDGIKFKWTDLLEKPLSEFLSRFFANRGFLDGLHGLSLSLLQAFSQLVVYLRLWEMSEFKEQEIRLKDLEEAAKKGGGEINYWFKYGNLPKNPLKRFLQRAKNKISR